jgi:tripartite-type tricarboxylate transporter receptor subunit TctC
MKGDIVAGGSRVRFLLCLLFGMAAAPEPASAADYPNRPIRLVIGFTAGGPTDIPARFIADRLSSRFGVPVVVENKPGAGATLAVVDVLSRTRDGYDLLVCSYFDPVNTLLYRRSKYQISDLQGISLITKYSYAVAVSNTVPVSNIRELVDYGRAHPNELNYGLLGVASMQNILAKQLDKIVGMKMTGLPFKGSADSLQELIAGRVHVVFGPPIAVFPFYEAKQIKVLAVTGDERLPSMPAVPTLKESGVPITAFGWLGICGGSGIPADIVAQLNDAVRRIVESPEYRDLVSKTGSVPIASTPQEFQTIIQKSADDVAPIVKEFDIRVD